ncbi:MAG: hypothetical protein WCI88_01680 [Chloroflexota bacterium]
MIRNTFDTLLPLGDTLEIGGKNLKILERLGGGLTSEVYRGELFIEGEFPIKVAIKAMKTLEFPTARQAFDQESLTLAMLMHIEHDRAKKEEAVWQKLNLASVKIAPIYYDQGEYEGIPYIVMEFISGEVIPNLIQKQGNLTESQALTAAWHLFRIMDILHTDLKKSFIDLKFDNLRWTIVEEKKVGQLKLIDFGTLEEIKPGNMRGVKRDLLLCGVYLFAMLTGHTLKYSLGELQERAEPLLKLHKDKMSWGTYQLLRRLLHRNSDQRPVSAKSIASEIQNLLGFWNGGEQILKDAEDRLGLAENKSESDPDRSRNIAILSRSALDIFSRLSQTYDSERLEVDIHRADELLALSDYLERGKNLFKGRAYDLAITTFEEGIKWTDDPAPLRRWAYLSMAGKVVPTASFDPNVEAAAAIVDLMNQERWDEALERLSLLQQILNSPGMDAMRKDCELFKQLGIAEGFRTQDHFRESGEAYRKAMVSLNKLPYKELIKSEEIGDLLTLAQEMEIKDHTRGEAKRKIQSAQEALANGDVRKALLDANESFTLDRENKELTNDLERMARQALEKDQYSEALQFMEIGIRVPHPMPNLLSSLKLARLLKSALQSMEINDFRSFIVNLNTLKSDFSTDTIAQSATDRLLQRAETWATNKGSADLLLQLAEFYKDTLKDTNRSIKIMEQAKQIQEKRFEVQGKQVDTLLSDATMLLYINTLGYGLEAAGKYNLMEFVLKLNDRRKTLEEAAIAVKNATQIAEPLKYKLSEISELNSRIQKELQLLHSVEVTQKQTQSDRLAALNNQWQEISGLHGMDAEHVLVDFIYQGYRYLYEVDPKEPLITKYLDQVFDKLDRLGQKGWQALQTTASRRLEEINKKFTDISQNFQNGDLSQVNAGLEELKQRGFEDAPEWADLKIKFVQAYQWQNWLKENESSLQKGLPDPTLLAMLRNYQRIKLPQVYWRNSSVSAYLKTARENVAQKLKTVDLGQKQEFIGVLNLYLNVDWTDRLLRGGSEPAKQWNSTEYLQILCEAAVNYGINGLQQRISSLQQPANIDRALSEITSELWQMVARGVYNKRRNKFPLGKALLINVAIIGLLTFFCVTTGLIGFCFFNTNTCFAPFFPHAPAPEVVIITATVQSSGLPITESPVTPTDPTVVPPTIAPEPTATPISYSKHLVIQPKQIYPPIPINADNVWLLNDTDVKTANGIGVFGPTTWVAATSSDPAAKKEPFYYTTFGLQPLDWSMDQPLYAGLYQLYVVDTLKQSSGEQKFTVYLDGKPVEPFRGQSTAFFAGDKQQDTDEWLPIGAYEVKSGQHLSVRTVLGARSKDNPFTIDRLLIVPVPKNEREMLNQLPQGRVLVSLLDDEQTNYNQPPEQKHWSRYSDVMAWNGSYIARGDPRSKDVKIDWKSVGLLTPGEYQLWVWLPDNPNYTSAITDFQLLADGVPIPRQNPAQIDQYKEKRGAWVDLGLWTLDKAAAVGVRLITKPENPGCIGVDAVAIVRKGQEN